MDLTAVPLVSLRVFQEVAERGTLSSAASALGYTQSAVSRQIAALERVVRAPLLDRQRDGVQLTDTGHVLLIWPCSPLSHHWTTRRRHCG
jgi:DNA-binding transcriptional LysR family regulator